MTISLLMGQKLWVPLFDVPHLIKGIRNNLITKELLYKSNDIEKVVKWEYYQKVYAADKSYVQAIKVIRQNNRRTYKFR